MSQFETVARVGDIPAGQGRAFTVDGKIVGVFHVDGEYYAINDLCIHMGASLSAGHLEDGVVMCPWHAWRFDVRDGTWCDNPKMKTESYPVRVVGEEIQVSVAGPDADSAPESSPEAAS